MRAALNGDVRAVEALAALVMNRVRAAAAPDGPRQEGQDVVPAANAGDASSANDARASAGVRRADFMRVKRE
jgi:hypothetical protein